MKPEIHIRSRAIIKVISCIDSCKTLEHIACCKKMIELLYNYNIKKNTLTYVMLAYRQKHKEIHNG